LILLTKNAVFMRLVAFRKRLFIIILKGEKTMAEKNNFGYYDENGKDENVYYKWNEWLGPTTGKNKISGTHYVKFDSAEEKTAFENNRKEFIERKKKELSTWKDSSAPMDSDKQSKKNILDDEKGMIKAGTWEDYLFKNIACEELSGYDALCVSDASFNEKNDCIAGSFGIIVIPLEKDNGKVKGDIENIIVESDRLEDDIDGKSFKRYRYVTKYSVEDEQVKIKTEEIYEKIELDEKVLGRLDNKKYVKTINADGAEAESATRMLEICMENNLYNIIFISDCKSLFQAIENEEHPSADYTRKKNKDEKPAMSYIRFFSNKKEWEKKCKKEYGEEWEKKCKLNKRKVGSHDNAIKGPINEFGSEEGDEEGHVIEGNVFHRNVTRLYELLNDLVDLMAKAELPVKSSVDAEDNESSIHLIPNEDGNYPLSKNDTDLKKIYNSDIATEDKDNKKGRRTITREIVKSVFPLIEQAISNGNNGN